MNYFMMTKPEQLYQASGKTEGNTFLYLDGINDPQNLGSIIRTAYFKGIDGILVNVNGRCPLSAAVSRVSAGALELTDMFCVQYPESFVQGKNLNLF